LNTPKKELIDEIFQGLDLDYSEFKETAEMAIFIASFIAVNVKKGISLKLTYHSWSGHHSLIVLGKKDILVTFRSSVGQYDLKNIYDGDQVIINTCDQEMYFYYIHELIKNVTFFNYLSKEDMSYMNAIRLTDKKICAMFGRYGLDVPNLSFGHPSIENTGVVYRFSPYCIFVSIKSMLDERQFCFSGGLNAPHGFQTEVLYFNTFHELVCHMNKYIYENVVEPIINVPSHEFTLRHRDVMNMIAI
jgi:hypothetical protein